MPTQSHNSRGILQYWQAFLGLASVLIGIGVFYAKSEAQGEKIRALEAKQLEDKKTLEARQDRQFEINQKLEGRIIELEKRTEYYKGLREGRNEAIGTKKAE